MITAELAALITKTCSIEDNNKCDYWEKFQTKNRKLINDIGKQIRDRAKNGYYGVQVTVDVDGETYYTLCGYLRDAKGYGVKSDRKIDGPHTLIIYWEDRDY